jgi:hypothetical protein
MHKIEEMLIEFGSMGISEAAIERALDLGQGSLRVASLTEDPEATVLLRLIRVYPWLIDVAESNFDENTSQRIMLHNAVDVMMNEKHNKLKKQ